MIAHLLKVKGKLFFLLNRNYLAHVYQFSTTLVQLGYSGRHCTLALTAPSHFAHVHAPEPLHLLLPSHHLEFSGFSFRVELLSSPLFNCILLRVSCPDCTVHPYSPPAYHFIFFVPFGITCNFSVSLHLSCLFL